MFYHGRLKICAVAVSAMFALAGGSVAAEDLVLTGPGGNTAKQWQKIVFDTFEDKSGNTVTLISLGGDESLAKAIAEVDSPSIDLFQFPGGQEVEGASRGVFQSVGDLSGAGLREGYVGKDGSWVGAFATLNGIVYNTKHIPTPPTSVLDLLKPEYAGHVGIPAMTSAKGPAMLVALSRASGGDENNVEAGMKAVGELLKGGAKVYSKASQFQSMLAQEEIWIAYYDANNALTAQEGGVPAAFAAPKEGMLGTLTTYGIAKNSPKGEAARALMAHLVSPEVQQALANDMVVFPAIEGASMTDETLARIGVSREDLDHLIRLDAEAISNNRAEWLEQFNRLAIQ